MPTQHELKIWPAFFEQVISGKKKFEIRRNNRNYQVGDILLFREYKQECVHGYPTVGEYTGRKAYFNIDYILEGYQWGIRHEFVAMSISPQDMC